MNKNLALAAAGIVFTVIAIIHLIRLVFHWNITVNGYLIPIWASIVGFLAAFVLCIWMLYAYKSPS